MPENPPPRPPPDGRPADIASLADTLIRRLFTVSMDLHQALGRLSTLDGDGHLPGQHPERNGRFDRHAEPIRADSPAVHQEAERLRQTLGRAIGELDEQIHDIRSLVAHTITPPAAEDPGFRAPAAEPSESGEIDRWA